MKRNERGEFEPTEFQDIKIGEIFLYGENEIFYKNKKDSAIFLADDWDSDWASYDGEPCQKFYFIINFGGRFKRLKKNIQERWLHHG